MGQRYAVEYVQLVSLHLRHRSQDYGNGLKDLGDPGAWVWAKESQLGFSRQHHANSGVLPPEASRTSNIKRNKTHKCTSWGTT